MTTIFLTSASAGWIVPANWNSANNIIECIGGGGGGAASSNSSYSSTGGGGGGYSAINNVTLSPGDNILYSVGRGGNSVSASGVSDHIEGNEGTMTYLTITGSPSVQAAGGMGGITLASGNSLSIVYGGQSSSGIGDTKFSGGNAGRIMSGITIAPTGGGGAAGPHGDGKNGADTDTTGGNATSGGDADNGNSAGGRGGSGGYPPSPAGNGTNWDATHGSGGGGGGSQFVNAPVTGGDGGLYGGGGGGAGYITANTTNIATSGAGKDGLIIITYDPLPSGDFNMPMLGM